MVRLERRRRGMRPRNFSDDEEADPSEPVVHWRVTSRPTPDSVKSCLKRPPALLDSPDAPRPARLFTRKSIPDMLLLAKSQRLPLVPLCSPVHLSLVDKCVTPKSVRVLEPERELAELAALREFWSAPPVHSKARPAGEGNGIAGYRRTRDIYAKGQGGTTAATVAVVVDLKTEIPDGGLVGGDDGHEEALELVKRTTRSTSLPRTVPPPSTPVATVPRVRATSLPRASARLAALSPSPLARTSASAGAIKRSPSPIVIGRRRTLSTDRALPLEDKVVSPRWVKRHLVIEVVCPEKAGVPDESDFADTDSSPNASKDSLLDPPSVPAKSPATLSPPAVPIRPESDMPKSPGSTPLASPSLPLSRSPSPYSLRSLAAPDPVVPPSPKSPSSSPRMTLRRDSATRRPSSELTSNLGIVV